jgi:hypothetical protein
VTSPRLLILAALLGLTSARGTPPAAAADRDPARIEAARLAQNAADRARLPGGAVDLIRLAELAEWLPRGEAEAHLRDAALDGDRLPLGRAVAWWLLREEALTRLDTAAVAEAQAALGLLDGFSMRIGGAPHPVAELVAADFVPYPRGAGGGVLWLDSYLRPDREISATVVTRLVAPSGGPAVLRLGYDDAATVWLNGDEVHVADTTHPAWLDQVAIPIALRAGDNRLVVEVRQRSHILVGSVGRRRLALQHLQVGWYPRSAPVTNDCWVRKMAKDCGAAIAECEARGATFTATWLKADWPKILKTIRHEPEYEPLEMLDDHA